MNMMESQ